MGCLVWTAWEGAPASRGGWAVPRVVTQMGLVSACQDIWVIIVKEVRNVVKAFRL